MQPSFKERAAQKAFELSYAIFRVSSGIKSRTFAERMENQALLLLEAGTAGNYPAMKQALHTIEYFLRLAADTNIIYGPHAEQIFQELVNLYQGIESQEEKEEIPPVNLEGIFSAQVNEKKEESGNPAEVVQPRNPEIQNAARVIHRVPTLSAESRQEKILGAIRQSGNCRFKDLLGVLPDSSERTLRYDLQDLIEKGLIQRLGSGGPATFYKAVEQTPAEPAPGVGFQAE